MPYKTHIESLTVSGLHLPLKSPFGISSGALSAANNLLVRVDLHGGVSGFGEAAPFPAFNGETKERVTAALMAVRERVLGANVRHWRKFARDLADSLPSGAARCALDTAILDAFTRYQNTSIWRYLGGHRRQLRTDLTISTGTPSTARMNAAAAVKRGFRTLKIKVGGGAPDADAERIRLIREAAPAAVLLLDANGGYTVEQALALLTLLRKLDIKPALFEQPVTGEDLAGLAHVHREGQIAVAADESACSAADVRAIIKANAAQVINIKLTQVPQFDAGVALFWCYSGLTCDFGSSAARGYGTTFLRKGM